MIANFSSLPIHDNDDIIYVRMKALTWIANHGFMPEMVQPSAGKLLAEIIQHDLSEGKIIILNFFGIASIDDHALDNASDALKETGLIMVAINASQLKTQLNDYIEVKPNITLSSGAIIFNSSDDKDGIDIEDKVLKIETEIIIDIVRRSYESFPEMTRLRSTPIYASGVFNARRIISSRKDFMWTSLIMSEKLATIMDEYKPKASRLLAVSLRASPFAGALGILGSFDIEIVDHMGPDLKILEEYTLRIDQEEINYIYIGDFIIGGTELKIAETYAVVRSCIVDHALVIGSLLEPSDYKSYKDRPNVHSLVKLKEVKPEAKYEIERQDA